LVGARTRCSWRAGRPLGVFAQPAQRLEPPAPRGVSGWRTTPLRARAPTRRALSLRVRSRHGHHGAGLAAGTTRSRVLDGSGPRGRRDRRPSGDHAEVGRHARGRDDHVLRGATPRSRSRARAMEPAAMDHVLRRHHACRCSMERRTILLVSTVACCHRPAIDLMSSSPSAGVDGPAPCRAIHPSRRLRVEARPSLAP
jgi:hypothetical protein